MRCPRYQTDGRLASGSDDHTIRLWDLSTCVETARLETDAPIHSLIALPSAGLVAGDDLGRFGWKLWIEAGGPKGRYVALYLISGFVLGLH